MLVMDAFCTFNISALLGFPKYTQRKFFIIDSQDNDVLGFYLLYLGSYFQERRCLEIWTPISLPRMARGSMPGCKRGPHGLEPCIMHFASHWARSLCVPAEILHMSCWNSGHFATWPVLFLCESQLVEDIWRRKSGQEKVFGRGQKVCVKGAVELFLRSSRWS